MKMEEAAFAAALIAVNLGAGISLAVVLARRLREAVGTERSARGHVVRLLGVYALECVAFAAGMATQVLTVALAIVWGVVFGRWFRGRPASGRVPAALVLLGIYTSLPTASFCLLLLGAKLLEGVDVASRAEAATFGIPQFLPWPLNTILGFCIALALGTLAAKLALTSGLGWLIAREAGSRPSAADAGG